MHKRTRNCRLRAARQLASVGTLALGLVAGCGSSDSEATDAAPQVNHDAAATLDAAISDAGAAFDAEPIDPDASVPTGSQRALWFGDFTTNGVDEVRLYDGVAGLSSLTIAGVTVIDDVQSIAVSPSGAQVAIALAHDGGTPTLYVANIDGTGTPVTIFDTGDAAATFSAIAWSPDGTQLAYIADTLIDGQKLVFAAPASASAAPVLVSQDPGNAAQDAQTIAWTDNSHVVYRADLVTDTVENFYLTDITASPPAPVSLIPDDAVSTGAGARDTAEFAGGKVYFKSNHEGAFKMYRVDPDGQNLEIVPALAALINDALNVEAGTFAISPDGANIAFSADAPTALLYQVYVAPLDGTATLQSNVAVANPTPTSIRGPIGETAIRWSGDGSMLGITADWPVNVGDLDNDHAGFIVPAIGAAGGIRIWKVDTVANSQDLFELAFSSDSTTLFALGDLRTNNDNEVFVTTDLATPDQDTTTTLTQGVPTGGDVFELRIIP